MSVFLQEQFNVLDHEAKIAHIMDNGIYLGVYRSVACSTVFLYHLFNFYVEVWMEEKKVIKTNAFTSYQKLDLYLEEIDISSVYALL